MAYTRKRNTKKRNTRRRGGGKEKMNRKVTRVSPYDQVMPYYAFSIIDEIESQLPDELQYTMGKSVELIIAKCKFMIKKIDMQLELGNLQEIDKRHLEKEKHKYQTRLDKAIYKKQVNNYNPGQNNRPVNGMANPKGFYKRVQGPGEENNGPNND